jgi:hypothetical protein
MRLRNAFVLLAAAALAACGGGRQEGVVSFKGQNPNTSLQKDNRSVSTHCPGCLKPIEAGTERCPDKKFCDTRIYWKESYRCPSCQGSTACQACVMMEQLPDGKCFNCKGTGNLIYFGKAPECASCKGKGACPICKGSKRCDYCQGAGKISQDEVKSRAAGSLKANKEEDDAPAKSEMKKGEAKPEPAKTEEPKAEEKKP